MTQEELDQAAQEEADALLAQHRTRIALSAEEVAKLNAEKQTLLSRVGALSEPDNGPRARRLASRDQGGPEAPPYEPPAPQPLTSRHAPVQAPPAEILAHFPGTGSGVDLDSVDPIQLAELAEAVKTAKKAYLAAQAEFDKAAAAYVDAQARFTSYLQP